MDTPELSVRAGARPIPICLHPVTCFVLNDTRVIPAADAEARVAARSCAFEILLHKRGGRRRGAPRPAQAKKPPYRRRPRLRIRQRGAPSARRRGWNATIAGKAEGGDVVIDFDLAGPALDEAIAIVGELPLPPYIAGKRAADARDRADYQTIYAREEGAVAAPTAGLHFTDALFARLDTRGIARHFVTLHVGAGTFLPVKVEDTRDHRMHAETGFVSRETADALNAARAAGGRIVAVGTTSLRLLESAATEDGTIAPFAGDTDIFITPGYRFRAVDALMTNFHLPKSTLMMLVSAFSGLDTMRRAYHHAVDTGYRFYSFGDSSLLFRDAARQDGMKDDVDG